jgi:hypothetical protein
VDAAVEAAMAPYDVNAYREYNPKTRWDWWQIYTPPEARLRVRPEHDGDPHLIHHPVHPNGETRPVEPLRCDGGPLGLLDVSAMTAEVIAEAAHLWDAWAELVRSHPPAEPLSAILERHRDQPPPRQLKLARAEHLAQPLVQAFAVRAARCEPPFATGHLLLDPIEHFAGGRQRYLDRAAARALATFALLDLEGQWIDPDNIGDVVTVAPGETPEDACYAHQRRYLSALAAEVIIVRVVCHG